MDELFACHAVFIEKTDTGNLNEILNQIGERPILTISDSQMLHPQGAIINMAIKEGKVIFDANQSAARKSGLKLNSQLLRFATEVYP